MCEKSASNLWRLCANVPGVSCVCMCVYWEVEKCWWWWGVFGDQLRKRHARPHSSPTLQNQLWSTGSGAPVSLLPPPQCDNVELQPSTGRWMIWSVRDERNTMLPKHAQVTPLRPPTPKKAVKKYIHYFFFFLFFFSLGFNFMQQLYLRVRQHSF